MHFYPPLLIWFHFTCTSKKDNRMKTLSPVIKTNVTWLHHTHTYTKFFLLLNLNKVLEKDSISSGIC